MVELLFVILDIGVEGKPAAAIAAQPQDLEIIRVHLPDFNWRLMDLKSRYRSNIHFI